MATRERRLAEFNGEGEPPPDVPVQVLCEDQSGTYLLPFACRYIDGEWRNHESGSTVEATVVGWRFKARFKLTPAARCVKMQRGIDRILRFGTRAERTAPESAAETRTAAFTARYRPQSQATHHMQLHRNPPQAADNGKR